MDKQKAPYGAVVLVAAVCLVAAGAETSPTTRPAALRGLDAFYTQPVVVDGLVIAGSSKVSPRALREAAHLVRRLLAKRPDVLRALVRNGVRVGVMASTEMTRDIPEHSRLSPWWDKRARGLGGNPVTCGEENLLAYRGDPYAGENIFIHEFAHIIHGRGLRSIDKTFEPRLRALYERARASGRFRGYGMVNMSEFWAEGVQSWFDCNRAGGLAVVEGDAKAPRQINTRSGMREYLPEFAAFLDAAFGQTTWTYVPVARRLGRAHLKGYDPSSAPTFRWPRAVIEAFRRIEADKAARRRADRAKRLKAAR